MSTVADESPKFSREDFTFHTLMRIPPVEWGQAIGWWMTSGQNMLRSFSILRILVGSGMLILLATTFLDRHYAWGFASTWIDPAADLRGFPAFFNIFPKQNLLAFDLMYWLLILTVIAFIVGAYTRVVTPVLLLLWVGMSTNTVLLANGGDVVMRLSLFFLMFANLSQYWSIDSLRRRRKKPSEYPEESKRWVPTELINSLHNAALLVLMWQAIVIYVNSGVFKLRGKEWMEGSALYYALNLEEFTIFPALSELVWHITPVLYAGAFVGIWVQVLFPLLLIWKPSRYVGLALLMGMHLGIALLFGLWPFSLSMIALDMLFIRDSSWEKGWAAIQRWRRSRQPQPTPT